MSARLRLPVGRIGAAKGAHGGIVVEVISAWAGVVAVEVGHGIIVMEEGGGREGSLGCLVYLKKNITRPLHPLSPTPSPLPPKTSPGGWGGGGPEGRGPGGGRWGRGG